MGCPRRANQKPTEFHQLDKNYASNVARNCPCHYINTTGTSHEPSPRQTASASGVHHCPVCPAYGKPHDTRHEAIRQHQRNTYQRALAAAKQRGLNITAAHKAALQCLKNNLAAYTSSQQPFLENPKKPFSEIPKISG